MCINAISAQRVYTNNFYCTSTLTLFDNGRADWHDCEINETYYGHYWQEKDTMFVETFCSSECHEDHRCFFPRVDICIVQNDTLLNVGYKEVAGNGSCYSKQIHYYYSPHVYIQTRKQMMVVDIYNCFRKENIDSSLGVVSFVNKDTCLQLIQKENGDYSCEYLKDKILMYYPDDYNIVFMLCDPPTASNELYVYIDSTRYLIQPQKTYPVYTLDDFFSTYLYLDLKKGDSLLLDKKSITLNEDHMYEILEVVDDYLKVREVQYDETHIPRITSLPTAPIYMYHWRDGYKLHTERFVIDE